MTDWLDGRADPPLVAELLRQVVDPEVGVNIVDLGLVYNISVSEGTVLILMSLTTPGGPLSAYMADEVRRVLWGAPGVADVDLRIIWEPAWSTEMMSVRAKQELGWPRSEHGPHRPVCRAWASARLGGAYMAMAAHSLFVLGSPARHAPGPRPRPG